MRIIGGLKRGTRLVARRGLETRPTADRARESLFNMLEGGRLRRPDDSLPIPDARVLDAFAGTGAFGLEALSRGAASAVFMENARTAAAALNQNIRHCHAEDRTEVLTIDAAKPPPTRRGCDLVFLDPPYGEGLANTALAMLLARGWVADNALLVVQTHPKETLEVPAGLSLFEQRSVGSARFAFLTRQPGNGASG